MPVTLIQLEVVHVAAGTEFGGGLGGGGGGLGGGKAAVSMRPPTWLGS